MKKLFTFLVLVLLITGLKAQTAFQENFDATTTASLPTGWTVFNVDGLTPYYTWFTNAWVCAMPTGTSITTRAAWSTSYYVPAGTANDWMFTPAIVIPTSNPVLQYTEYTPNASYPDGYEVRIMTAAPTTANLMTSTVLLSVTAAATTPTQKTINLSAYAGQTVYIGWRNNSVDMLVLAIDDIVVKGQHNNDIALTAITTPANVAVGNNNIAGSIKNVGQNTITSYDVTYSVNSGTTSAVYSVTGQSIATGATSTFTHNVPANLAVGYDTVLVTLSNINGTIDSNSYDNSLKKVLNCRPNNDLTLSTITTAPYLLVGNANISGTVTSKSVTPITSYDVTYTIDGGAASAVYSVTGQNIAYLATNNFTHNVPANLTLGSHTIQVTISNVNGATDPNPADNVLSKSVFTVSSAPTKRVFCEEATGTWCGYCVRGIVNMDAMGANHPTDWVGVAVHNADGMVVSAWDAGIGAFPGFTGYPTIVVDRTILTDPSSAATAYATQKAVVSPVDVSLGNVSFNETTRTISFDVKAKAVTTGTVNWRINGAIYEMGVNWQNDPSPVSDSSKYQQHNYYANNALGAMGGFESLPSVISANSIAYDWVGRALCGGFAGTASSIPASITDGTTYTQTYTYVVPAYQKSYTMHVVGFVVDQTTGQVLNAIQQSVSSTGINEVSASSNNIRMYPNPTKGIIHLEGLNAKSQITVTDILGNTVMTVENTNNIDLSNNVNGVYFIKVTSGNNVHTEKVVLNR